MCAGGIHRSRFHFPNALNASRPTSTVALGDSYTLGEGVTRSQRPAQLVSLLRAERIAVADADIIVTDRLEDGRALGLIEKSEPRGRFGRDAPHRGERLQGRTAGEYPVRFRSLLRRAIGFRGWLAGARDGAVGSRLGSDTVREGPRSQGDRSRDLRVQWSESGRGGESGRPRRDIYGRLARGGAVDSSLIVADGLHPSAVLHERVGAADPADGEAQHFGNRFSK